MEIALNSRKRSGMATLADPAKVSRSFASARPT